MTILKQECPTGFYDVCVTSNKEANRFYYQFNLTTHPPGPTSDYSAKVLHFRNCNDSSLWSENVGNPCTQIKTFFCFFELEQKQFVYF